MEDVGHHQSRIGTLEWSGVDPLFILGPCVMESEDLLRRIAATVAGIAADQGVPVVFKASYDKANRTSVSSFRGVDCEEGCRLLASIGEEFGLPVTTDVHTAEEARVAGEHVDFIQIPAFLSRQTDLLEAAARTGRPVNVKKGQFMAPWDTEPVVEKLRHFGCEDYWITERGVSFGYNNLVADMRSLYWIREKGHRVIFDATHSVQRPGGLGGSSGGDGILAPVLARAAVAAGCDGVFMETHPEPEKALSDGPNQVPLDELSGVVAMLTRIHRMVNSTETIEHAEA